MAMRAYLVKMAFVILVFVGIIPAERCISDMFPWN